MRHRWRFILPAFLVTATVLGASLFLPRKYTAEAIFERRTDMVLTEMSTQGATRAFKDPRGAIIEELTGQPAVDRLLKDIEPELRGYGLVNSRADLHALQQNVERMVTVRWDISSGAHERIRVSYTASSPKLTQLVVNTLVENHIQQQRAVMEDRLRQSAEFFRNEMERNRSAIETLENELLDFEIKHAALLPENPNNVQVQISDSQDARAQLVAARDAAATRALTLRSSVAKEPKLIQQVVRSRNPEVERLQEKLRKLQEEESNFIGFLKMKDAHPDLIALREQITQVEQEITQVPTEVIAERQDIPNPKRAELELRLTQAQSEHEALSQQLVSLDHQLTSLDGDAGQLFTVRSAYRKLTRDVEQTQRQVAFWEDNLRRVELALAADAGDKGVQLDFIRPAEANPLPVSPDFTQVFMAAIVLGLLAGGLNVFFTHRTNESFNSGEKAAASLDLDLIGAVSEIVTAQHRRMRRLRRMILYPINAVVMGSVLIVFGTLLYLDLQKPHMFSTIKANAADLIAPAVAEAGDQSQNDVPVQPMNATE